MYQVLYRKYRPKVFADVYGQDHVTSTLKNEIKEGRVSHAYLFTGSRGTGKTTCAKILAKAVNCENSTDGEPCNECEVCKGLDNGTIYDVVEIDAASNNGVDNIRDLREEVNYTPSRGKYRVYIIDEVHMLSTGAFNALLKTLEEPPSHVIFILATTEVHKLPATILSRCQRFDFKRIQPDTMAIRLNEVAKAEGMSLDDDAAVLIARIADGALRDGLSILDQCAGRDSHITSQLVSQVAGLAGRESLYDLTDAISAGDSSGAMSIIADLHENSYDMERLASEMISHLRNFLVTKSVKDSRTLIVCTDDEYNRIVQGAEKMTLQKVIFALDMFQSTLTRIKSGSAARVEMEMAFVRLCQPRLDTSIDAINDRLGAVEAMLAEDNIVKSNNFTTPTKTVNTIPVENNQPTVNKENITPKKTDVVKTETVAESKGNDFTDEFVPEPPFDMDIPYEPEPVSSSLSDSLPPKDETVSDNSDVKAITEDEDKPPFEVKAEVQPTTPEIDTVAKNIPAPAQVESAPVNTDEPGNEQVEFLQWPAFIDAIHHSDISLFGLLNGARGYTRGEFFLIDSNNPTIKEFIKVSTHSRAIKKALFELTGKKYKLGLFTHQEEKSKVQRRDPLEDLIGMAKTDGLDFNEK